MSLLVQSRGDEGRIPYGERGFEQITEGAFAPRQHWVNYRQDGEQMIEQKPDTWQTPGHKVIGGWDLVQHCSPVFGALLILMGIICVDALHTLRNVEKDNAQIRLDFRYRERTLERFERACMRRATSQAITS